MSQPSLSPVFAGSSADFVELTVCSLARPSAATKPEFRSPKFETNPKSECPKRKHGVAGSVRQTASDFASF